MSAVGHSLRRVRISKSPPQCLQQERSILISRFTASGDVPQQGLFDGFEVHLVLQCRCLDAGPCSSAGLGVTNAAGCVAQTAIGAIIGRVIGAEC